MYLCLMSQQLIDIQLEATLTGHQNPIFALAQPIDSQILYSGGNDKGVVQWDLKQMKFERILCKVPSSVYSLLAIPNTNLLAIGMRSGHLFIVDTNNQSLVANLKTEDGAIFDIKVIPGKDELIAIGEEGFAYVWSLNSYNLLYRFRVTDTTSRVIALNNDQSILAFGDKNGLIHTYNTSDFQELNKVKIHEMPVTSLLFIGDSLISGGRDAKLFKLDINTLAVKQQIVPHMFTVYGIKKGNNEDLFATVSRDKTLKIWRERDLALLKNISRDKGYDSHGLSINTVLFEDYRIFTASDDKSIKVWNLELD